MRKGVLAAAGLALLAGVALGSAPARAMPLAAPTAIKGIGEAIGLTDKVYCWDGCGGGYYRPYYRRHYGGYYRPYYRPYGYYRPYYRPYYSYYRPYRPYYGYGYRPWWLSGPYYGPPRPRFYVGSSVYWY